MEFTAVWENRMRRTVKTVMSIVVRSTSPPAFKSSRNIYEKSII